MCAPCREARWAGAQRQEGAGGKGRARLRTSVPSHARATVWLPGRVGVGDSGSEPAASGAGGGGACPQRWAQPHTHQALSHDSWPTACGAEGQGKSPADSTFRARGCQSLHFPAQPHPQRHLSCTQAELSPQTQKPGSGLRSAWLWVGHSAKPTFLRGEWGQGSQLLLHSETWPGDLPLSRHPRQQLQATRQVPG